MPTIAEMESSLLSGLSTTLAIADIKRTSPRIVAKEIPNVNVLTTGGSPHALFTVTGHVMASVIGVTGAALASTSNTGTIAIGISGATALYLPQTTVNGTNFPAAGTVWTGDNSPTLLGEVLSSAGLTWAVQSQTDIIATVATNSLTTGSITFYCFYIPLSETGLIVAA